MPSFKFRGFAASSEVALSVAQGAQSADATLVWAPPQASPNASFAIEFIDGPVDVVAPFGAVLRATGFSGFSVSEPPGDDNVYDPTQHRITYVWDFGDPDYAPILAPNIPTLWRNTNIAYGKQVAHVWNAPGEYTVTCFAFDEDGNWGTASYRFGPGGDAPAIANPDVFFPLNKTICVSQTGDFEQAPPGSTKVTSIAAAHAAMQSLWGTGQRNMRVLVRAGEEYTETIFFDVAGAPFRDNLKGLHVGRFGPGARPVIRNTGNAGAFLGFPDRNDCRQFVVSDIDFRGPWSTATETGPVVGVANLLFPFPTVIIHRSRFDGFDSGPTDRRTPKPIILSDCEVTNWANYAAFTGAERYFFIGCDFHQHEDALNGIGQDSGGQQTTELGNRHGGQRSGSEYDSVMSCCAFFSRTGWFPASNGTTHQQSFEQACTRTMQHFSGSGINLRRHHHVWDRCSFEGGDAVAAIGPSIPPNNFMEINPKNFVIDKCLFVGTPASYSSLLGTSLSGITIRNSYFYRRNIGITYPNQPGAEISTGYSSNNGGVGLGPIEIYSNTILIETPGSELAPGYTPISVGSGAGLSVIVENNVVRVVNRAEHSGEAFTPLGTDPLDGFVCRYKGARWNFRPVIIGVGAARANETGTAGDVGPGQWIAVPYPDNTGQCAGAGFPVTQALVLENSTQLHQLSVTDRPPGGVEGQLRRMGPTNGRATFDFTPTAIRIRNDGSLTWPSGVDAWILLDLSDYLMDFLQGTDQSGLTIPAPVPGPDSIAFSGGGFGRLARDDFFGNLRAAQPAMGAFQPGG